MYRDSLSGLTSYITPLSLIAVMSLISIISIISYHHLRITNLACLAIALS